MTTTPIALPEPETTETLLYIGVYADDDTGPRTLEVVFTSDSSEGERAFVAEFAAGDDPLQVFAKLGGIAQSIYQRYACQT